MTDLREPSTASIRRIDMSASRPRASASPADWPSEAALFDAYRIPASVMVSRDCVCGGDITARRGDWAWITASVRAHQETSLHLAWREWAGIE